ncbi:MAG: Ldh family oxidoreductase [Rhodospirillales bacterium]|jgi:ureidoglycolate dehydrogenase (NAD+)|nr:dehydrogenase [Rhodospirillaceae bacterium]MDP6427937.1 Ldh family oxidoreductase [Rhodospirillales bacterium]
MTGKQPTFQKDALLEFARSVFVAAGVEPANAELWADILIWANLRGVDSHGVLRIPEYIDHIDTGKLNPRPRLGIERSAGAAVSIDADRAPGPVAMKAAMDEAILRAREVQVGWSVVRNNTHAGAIGYFALHAARQGFAGMAMTASSPLMAHPGARVRAASTNPIAIAVPGGDHPPLFLDMSTSASGMGKISQAKDAGASIPEGWALDDQGQPTTDPHQAAMLSPMSGAKGSGLSLMIECLTSLFAGVPLIEYALSTGKPRFGRPMNGLAVAVDVSAFGDLGAYRDRADALAQAIGNLPAAEGTEQVYAPGERGDAVMAIREKDGIPLPAGTIERLKPVAERFGIRMPAAD